LANAYFEECPMGNFAADALRAYMQADIAVLMSGLFINGLPGGSVTVGDLNAACFTTANPARTQLSGAEIRQLFEKGMDPRIVQTVNRSFRGPPIGIPQISGLTVEYNPHAPVGSKIKRIRCSGKDLEPGRTYSVAHTDAEVMDEFGYFRADGGKVTVSDVPTILPEVLAWYLKSDRLPQLPAPARWQIVPD
jgi:2',3'-cyclic-nucleotide 2'-phosphodiesterase (5'-nucleotidase family)